MLALECVDAVFNNLSPPPKITLSEWADKYRQLSPESSAEPGQWKTDRAPYQRGMMDVFSDRTIHTVVDMTSSQVGKTEKHLNTLGYFIDYDPAPILVVQPTIKMAEAFSKDRLAPMIRDSPTLAKKIMSKKKGDSTIYHKKFVGGHVTLAGANSPASLASRPIRILLCDEVDRWPASAGTEGDPLNIARKRTSTFHNRKTILSSTPGNKYIPGEGGSRIEFAWLQSDQRHYFVPCPHCDHEQHLEWEQVKWSKDELENDLAKTAYYECKSCKGEIYEHHKLKMLRRGKWIATATSDGIAGFHLNELYSPWKTIVEVVEEYLEAKDDIELFKVWVNTSLGLPFEHKGGDQPDWKKLYDRRENRPEGKIPAKVVLLTAGVDVQQDRLEVSIVGWNRKRSWLIEHRRLIGDTANEEVWNDLSELLDHEYDHPNGEKIAIRVLGIDSGYQTSKVYDWVRKKSKRRVFALKGRDQLDTPVSAPSVIDVNFRGKKSRVGIKLWKAGVSVLKSELYGRLNIEKPTDSQLKIKGYPVSWVAFPQTDEEYFKQLTAETCVLEKTSSGHAKYVWKKTYRENHALDCFIYAMAGFYVIGANKWGAEKWDELSSYYQA